MTGVDDFADAGDTQRDEAKHGGERESFTHPAPETPWLTRSGRLAAHWLVAYGHGPDAEAVAEAMAEQCRQGGVYPMLRTVDEVVLAELRHFPGVVLVLPSARSTTGQMPESRRFREIVSTYRSTKRRAEEVLIPRSEHCHTVGVLQAGPDVSPSHPNGVYVYVNINVYINLYVYVGRNRRLRRHLRHTVR